MKTKEKELAEKKALEKKLTTLTDFFNLVDLIKIPHLRDLIINITHAKIHCTKKTDVDLPTVITSNIENLRLELTIKSKAIQEFQIQEVDIIATQQKIYQQLTKILELLLTFLHAVNVVKDTPTGPADVEEIYIQISDLTKDMVKTSIDKIKNDISLKKEEYNQRIKAIEEKKYDEDLKYNDDDDDIDPNVKYVYQDKSFNST